MSELVIGEPAPRYRVRYRGHPVRFHTNVTGRVWCIVPEDEATEFSTRGAALARLAAHGLPLTDAGLETFMPTPMLDEDI
jgi:hypothetical protein